MTNFSPLMWNVDIVFVIDTSRTMAPFINRFKDNICDICNDFLISTEIKVRKPVHTLRIRIVSYGSNSEDHPPVSSEFFLYPQQADEIRACVQAITADGESDSSLTSIAISDAFHSRWNTEQYTKTRHAVVLFSDKSFSNIPETYDQLSFWWGSDWLDENCLMKHNTKRFILFSPSCNFWNQFVLTWDKLGQFPVAEDSGLIDLSQQEITQFLSWIYLAV